MSIDASTPTTNDLPDEIANNGFDAGAAVLRRDNLVNKAGIRYRDFKHSLKPKFAQVWMQLLAGHVTLILIAAAVVCVHLYVPTWDLLAILLAAGGIGYTIAYIALFHHEAAHYNLTSNRISNDRLADLFISPIIGLEIKAYRVVHFDHHRHLGTPQDTEYVYFYPLNLRFIAESLTGVRMVKVFLNRMKHVQSQVSSTRPEKKRTFNLPFLLGVLIHGSIIVIPALLGIWPLSIAWLLGVGVVFPFFGAIRPLLEHRDDHARGDIDYHRVPHGAVARIFGDGPVASTMGGAGFNRHLLHHWEPQVSYTRLRELEGFLLQTELGDFVRARQSSYWRTFLRLFRFW